jgi:hypothetical protein
LKATREPSSRSRIGGTTERRHLFDTQTKTPVKGVFVVWGGIIPGMFERMKKAWKAGEEGPKPGIPGTEAELAPIEAMMKGEVSAENLLEDKKEALESIKTGLQDYDGLIQERILSGVTDKEEQDRIMVEQKMIEEIWDRLSALAVHIGIEKQGTIR